MRILTRSITLRLAALTTLWLGLWGAVAQAAPTPTGQPVAYVLTPNNTITAIDTGSHAVLRTITLAEPATFIVGTPDGAQLYVTTSAYVAANDLETAVQVINTQTGLVTTTLPLGFFPSGIAVSPDGTRVYVASQFSDDDNGTVTVIDTATNSVLASINTNYESDGIAMAPNGSRVYVATLGIPEGEPIAGSVDVIDTASNTLLTSLHKGTYLDQFSWVAVSPDSSKIYSYDSWVDGLYDSEGSGVIVYDAATYAILNSAAPVPTGATLNLPLPNSSILYGINGGSVLVYNTLSDTVAKTIPVATKVNNLALTPDGTQLYASNSNAQSIAIIDTASNALAGSVAVAGATGLTIVASPTSVVLAPPVVTLQARAASVPPGSPVNLTWSSNGATSCTSSGAWSGSAALLGSSTISLYTPGNYTFTLTCTGPGGTSAASAKVTVVPGSTLTASSTTVTVGNSAVLSWKAFAGATSCLTGGTWDGSNAMPTSGTFTVGPFGTAGTYTYPLSCSGPSGGDTTSVSINVVAAGSAQFSNLIPPNDNVYAVQSTGVTVSSGGLDGHGYAYDSQDLPNPLVALGQTFAVGALSKPTGISNQTITLSSTKLASLTLLATGVNGPQLNQAFVVTYTDGTTKTFTQSLSDWGTSGNYAGESVAVTMKDRLTAAGAAQDGAWKIYAYTLTLDGTKLAKSLQLPKSRNVVVLAINESQAQQVVAESISASFNVDGLASAGHVPMDGGLDGHGYAYDSALLPSSFTGAGQPFTLGPANALDAVSNASIALPAKSRLGLTVLATAINGSQANQAFIVTYSDGTTTTFQQSVSDWGSAQNYPGETLARSTASRITPSGTLQGGTWDIYAHYLQTDSTKQVVKLTLPKNRSVIVFAVNSLTQ